MKRTLFCGFLAATSLLLALPAQAVQTVPIQVDGTALAVEGFLARGTTYVPLRSLLEALGGWTVSWDANAGRAVANSAENQLFANPSTDSIAMDGASFPGKVFLKNGKTYVPLRAVAEACGGAVGWDAIMGGASVTSEGAEYAAEDLYWLSRIISAESQGEPLRGQIAVGNVVVNRRAAAEFPDTIREVVFDRRNGVQFEPVSNGTVYLPPTPQSVEAARQVLAGEGAQSDWLYFYAPALSPGTWINANRAYAQTIGCHRFYR